LFAKLLSVEHVFVAIYGSLYVLSIKYEAQFFSIFIVIRRWICFCK